ncbi:MAG: methyltransferase domain-containing protein [Bacteroidetes bacterium]|nr:methyltransferase domain-containing protein [Bacteroidota bacterium]MBS1740396.1 methyltransferase domain-containing protein [Bacteroidota bacterium]
MFSKKDIARYYDLSEIHYKLFWNLDQSKSLHYGYWDATTQNFHEALINSNKKLAERAHISQLDSVLDAGCGVGGSTVWLAKTLGCQVYGVSLSEKQIKQAKLYAIQEGVDSLTHFSVQDFTATHFPSDSFSVVWAIETICHANNKADFLREAMRILKPGGRLILFDFFKQPNLLGKDAAEIKAWANGWAIDDYATQEDFSNQLTDAGFIQLDFQNKTKEVMKSIKRLYRAYILGVLPSKVYNFFHKNTSEFGKRNVDTAKLQYITVKRNLWKYLMVYAEKPLP